jgi:hypothetical protein
MKIEKGKAYIITNPFGGILLVNIYPVGFYSDIIDSLSSRSWRFHFKRFFRDIGRGKFRRAMRYFRGYVAKPDIFPGKLTKPASGWTRARAFRKLQRRVKRS